MGWCETLLLITTSLVMVSAESVLINIYVNTTSGNDSYKCLSNEVNTIPCKTLSYALEGAQKVQSSQIFLSAGNYTLPENESLTTFYDKTHFAIVGEGPEESQLVTIICDGEAGITMNHSSNIILKYVRFISCGAYHVSTSNSYNNTGTTEYLNFIASLYFLFCINVTFDQVMVANSNGMGVVFYSTVGRNLIRASNFTENTYKEDMAGGGGVSVEFIYCIPGDTECTDGYSSNIPITFSNGNLTSASYMFQSCRFIGNHGNTSNTTGDSFIVPHASSNVALGRGAGLSVLYKGNVTAIPITITDCKFEGNIAVWGGGMLIEFQDHSQDNIVTVSQSEVIGNECPFDPCTYRGTGGGGVRIQFASFGSNVKNNIVKFIEVQFIDNRAYFGGGVSLFTFPSSDKSSSNQLTFENCTWRDNVARLGSAIDISQWNVDGFGSGYVFLVPQFRDCTFDSNTVQYITDNFTGTPSGIGIVYTDAVPLYFNGETKFFNNSGSALVSLDAAVQFGVNSTTWFIGNEGRVGGAVALFNKGFLKLQNNSTLNFYNNDAYLHGGGIYWESIGDHQLISSRNCFIRFHDTESDPTDWPVKLSFRNNTATLSGQAIYATTLLGCLWGGKAYSKLPLDPIQEYNDVFCWNNDIWDYGLDNCTKYNIIATAPGYYAKGLEHKEVKCGEDAYSFHVVPGKPSLLDVQMLDDRLRHVEQDSVVFSFHLQTSNETVTTYTTYENLSYYGEVDEHAVLKLSTINPRVIATTVHLTFSPCPPGFVNFNRDSSNCERASFSFIRIYSNFSADIQFGYWIGRGPNITSNDLYVSQCLFCPWSNSPSNESVCNITTETNQVNYHRLPDSIDDLECMFCGGLNRMGIQCSQCKPGYCTAVNSPQYKCIEEDSDYKTYAWLFYILFEYAPLTLLLILVFLFNISVTSGPANAFIFFAQVVSTTFSVDAEGQINYASISSSSSGLKQAYIFLYGMWNLDFFTAIDYDDWLFCLGPHVNTLQVIALKYVTAFYPLTIIGMVIILAHLYNNNYRCIVCIFRPFHWLSARCLSRLNIQRSLMDCLATFFILSYVKFVVTACYLLYPNPLQNSDGSYELYTSYFDGSVHYKSKEYLPYLILSSFVIFSCLVLPLLLLFYSIKPIYLCLDRVGCRWLQPGEKMHLFLNSFHHCFKDGRNGEHDRRYFAAVYFFLKFLLIATYALGLDWTRQYIYQQIICTLGLLLVGTLQPYKRLLYNFLDMGMFSLLSIINVLSLYSQFLQAVNQPLSKIVYYVQVILVFIPIVYLVIYAVVVLLKDYLVRVCCKGKKRRDDLEFSFRHFMDDVETEDRFRTNNYYGAVQEEGQIPHVPPTVLPEEMEDEEEDEEKDMIRRDLSVTRKGRRYNTDPPRLVRIFKRKK